MAVRKGKPCGASHISSSKVCRVGLASEVNRAINAATGEIGAASLKAAVQKYAGGKGVDRLRELRREIRDEMGGNIVKGPRADELKKRLQNEGLLPPKGKSARPEFTPLPQSLKDKLAALGPPPKTEKKAPTAVVKEKKAPSEPDPRWASFKDDDLKFELEMAKNIRNGKGQEQKIKELEKEIAARAYQAANQKSKPNQGTVLARRSARRLDEEIEQEITRQLGDRNYDWTASRSSGSRKLGSGAYGTVMREGDKDGNAVKRGQIGNNEAEIMDRVGKADLGPRVHAADYDGVGYNAGTRKGRIAMDVVPGSPIGSKNGDKEIGKTGIKVADAYWTARANLHRLGIAHNDMHIENVFIDRKGKGRFVDLGLAQDNPKAALAEAMGVFSNRPTGTVKKLQVGQTGDGDWQVKRWDGSAGKEFKAAEMAGSESPQGLAFAERFPVAGRVLQNKRNAIKEMKRYGLDSQDIADVMTHGIRSTPESFEKGGMGKLTNEQAQSVINTLYEGI